MIAKENIAHKLHAGGVFIGLFFVGLVLYWRVLSVGFLSDDYHMLSVVAGESNPASYFLTNIIGERGGSSYGPIFNALMILQYAVFGLSSVPYHIVLLLLHAGTATLVFLTVRKLAGKNYMAAAAALLFLVFQGHVGSLAWIAVLPHIAATCFFWASLYAYTAFLDIKKYQYYVASLILFSLGLFTKEIIITGIAAIALLDVFAAKKDVFFTAAAMRMLKRWVPFALVILLYVFLRKYTTGVAGGYYGAATLSFDIAHMTSLFAHLTTHIFLPYPYRAVVAEKIVAYLPLVLFGLTACLVFAYRKTTEKILSNTMFFFLAGYSVVSLPFIQLLVSPVNDGADRYTYLMSSFFAPLLVCSLYVFIRAWTKNKQLPRILFVVLLCTQIIFTWQKQAQWIEAGKTVDSMLASAKELPDEKDTFSLFIGLPDNIYGAEVSRNAIKEAIFLETGRRFDGVRIPEYTAFLPHQSHEVALTRVGRYRFVLESQGTEKRLFTGFPKWVDEYGTFVLRDTKLPEHSGTAIDIELNEQRMKALEAEGKKVQVIYYTNGRLVAEPVN